MDCKITSELTPWLLNGTLKTAQRHLLIRHLGQCRNCRQELEETVIAGRVYGAHLAPEVLTDYGLDGAARTVGTELIESHLAHCERCRNHLELVRASRDLHPPEESVAPPPAGDDAPKITVSKWRYVAAGVGLAVLPLAAAGYWGWSRIGTLEGRLAGLSIENAALSLKRAELEKALALQSGKLAETRARISDGSEPLPNIPMFELFPSGSREGEGTRLGNPVEIPAGTMVVMLIMNSRSRSPYSENEIEILDSQGGRTWGVTGIRRSGAGHYTLLAPAPLLGTGTCTIKIYGIESTRRRELESYTLQVDRPAQ